MRKPRRGKPDPGPQKQNPKRDGAKPAPTENRRLVEQTRKILGKHYASKYRTR